MAHLGLVPDELQIDRAYLNTELSEEVIERGGSVFCKPWKGSNGNRGFFGKRDFLINVRDGTPITCPAGQVECFEPNEVVEFDPDVCGLLLVAGRSAPRAASGRGRTVTMGDNEALQKKLRHLQSTPPWESKATRASPCRASTRPTLQTGRVPARAIDRRERIPSISRRLAAIQNLETVARRERIARAA